MSSANSIFLSSQVQPQKVVFEKLAVNKYGGKFSKVSHNGGRWLLIQTPKINCPFGINVYEDKDKEGNIVKKTYSLDVSFSGFEPSPDSNTDKPRLPKVKHLHDLVQNMEKHLVKHAAKNSFTWIGDSDAGEPECKALLRTNIRYSKDSATGQISKKYAPRMKLDLPVWDGEMKFKAFVDTRDNEIKDIDELVKLTSGRCNIVAIVKCDKVTFNGGKYGLKWWVQQLKIYSVTNSMDGYAFIEDSDDDGDADEAAEEPSPASPTHVSDSSSEDEDEDEEKDELDGGESNNSSSEEEEEKPPTPKAKKKRVVRRKAKVSA